MAMHITPEGDDDEPQEMTEINTTPLIDVMLVLLIMLIITIPIQTHAVKLDLPTGPPPQQQVEPQVVQLAVTMEGRFVWNGERLADRAAMEARLSTAAGQGNQPEIHLLPDPAAPYRDVAAVMASAQRLGLTKIGIVGGVAP